MERSKIQIPRRAMPLRIVALLLSVCGIQALLAAPGRALLVQAKDGDLASFSAGVSDTGAAFGATTRGYGADRSGFAATYPGGATAAAAGPPGSGTQCTEAPSGSEGTTGTPSGTEGTGAPPPSGTEGTGTPPPSGTEGTGTGTPPPSGTQGTGTPPPSGTEGTGTGTPPASGTEGTGTPPASGTQCTGTTPVSTGSGTVEGALAVNWAAGQSVTYGASFRLPRHFHSADQGQQLLLAWSSASGADGTTQQGGVVIDYANNRAYLVTNTDSGGTVTQHVLAGSFRFPIARWFTLQVRQLLEPTEAGRNKVYVNGRLVASAAGANFSEQRIVRVDYGIAGLTGGAETGTVSLKLDRAIAAGYSHYVNPLQGDRYHVGRTDQGVDVCLSPGEAIRVVGDAVVVGISPDWFEGEPYIWYQLLDGPRAGQFVYVAEQIRKLARVGAALSAGQVIARYNPNGTCIETGWSTADGATLARVTTGYYEGEVTDAGVSFARFLSSLGVRGQFEFRPRAAESRVSRAAAPS